MKKIIMTIIMMLSCITLVYARTGGNETTPEELATSENKDEIYNTCDILLIRNEDVDYLDQVDFSRFSNLKDIYIRNTYFSDFDKIKPDKKYLITIYNSVVDLTNANLDDYDIHITNSFVINTPLNKDNINYSETLSQGELDIDSQYEDRINEIALELYDKSDKTPEGIVKEVVIYILENMEPGEGSTVTEEYNFFERHSGVCVDYAHMTSVFLNKLGIFTIDNSGFTRDNDPNSTHAWNNVYIDGKWYLLDVTWLDTEGTIEALRNSTVFWTIENYYMKPFDDEFFNSNHIPFFTNLDLIPEIALKSKTSLLNQQEEHEEEPVENSPEEEKKEINENDIKILEGDKQKYIKGQKSKLVFRANIEYSIFLEKGKVFIDEELVDSNNYELKEGSTIIEFNTEFIDYLKEGNHTLKLTAEDKEVEVQFAIENTIKNPNTTTFISIVLIVISFISITLIVYLKRKKANKYIV